jgi:murein DD-endopeptidase MepM/ murein hydrolase activator NlpD
MERKRKKRRILKKLKKLKKPFRLIVLNENTFEEKFSYSLTPLNVIAMLGGFIVVFSVILYLLIVFTPLKNVLVPDFSSYESREDARKARFTADSLTHVLQTQEKYFTDLKLILSGGSPVTQLSDTTKLKEVDLTYQSTELEQKLTDETNNMQGMIRYSGNAKKSEEGVFLFPPVSGSFVASNNSGAVVWQANANESVKSISEGTVIGASFSIEQGNIVIVQHTNNLISIYKNLKILLVSNGKKVKAGESLGWVNEKNGRNEIIFELWKNGQPENISNHYGY